MQYKRVYKRTAIKRIGDVNKIIQQINKCGLKPVKIGIGGDYPSLKAAEQALGHLDLNNYLPIIQKDTTLELITKWIDGKGTTYIFSLDGKPINEKSGQQCFMEFSRYHKMPKIIDKEWYKDQVDPATGKFTLSARPFIGYNEKESGKEFKDCYEYDLNSAYASVMLDKVPDLERLSEINWNGIKVKKGWVGFLLDDDLTLVEEGGKAEVVAPLIDCPERLREFIIKYYNIKKTSTGDAKQQAKDMLNLPIGYCQRYNPFFRAYIIHKCNAKINKLIDKDVLFWNTDAIFTKNKREDLDIGEGIGQFKEIKLDKLRYRENTYQINDEIPTYRGIPKEWFKFWEEEHGRPYNVLTDALPLRKNRFNWNWETLKLEVNK